jgi:hypothetical protein
MGTQDITTAAAGTHRRSSAPRLTVLLIVPEMRANEPVGDGRLQYLYDDSGMLHFHPSPPTAGTSTETRDQVLATLTDLMGNINQPGVQPADVITHISTVGQELFNEMLPIGLKDYLRSLTQPAAKNKIILYINGPEWIPWELMHDGEEFLGVSFQIARLPVKPLGDGYVTYEVEIKGRERRAERIANVLGKGALLPIQEQAWGLTFSGMSIPDDRIVRLAPSDDPRVANLMDIFKDLNNAPDILHITCHGDRPIGGSGHKTAWTLDMAGPSFKVNIGIAEVQSLCAKAGFKKRNPLVFGNACSSAANADAEFTSFASAFLAGGASAFVGTLAPISNTIAVDFASEFYKHLLGQELPVGEALQATKRHFSTQAGADPSWLFYCLYGSPATRYKLAQ